MQTNVYDTGDMIRVLEIKADASDLETDIRLAMKKIKRTAKFRGFRPGQAPMKMIRRIFNKDIELIVVNNLIKEVCEDIIDANDEYQVVGNVREIARKYTLGGDLEVRLEFFVVPKIILKDFRGHSLEVPTFPVTDQLIDRFIKSRLVKFLTPRPLQSNQSIGINSDGEFDQVTYQLVEIDSQSEQVIVGGILIEKGIFNFGEIAPNDPLKHYQFKSLFTGKFVGDIFIVGLQENPWMSQIMGNHPKSSYRIKIQEAYRFDWPEIDDIWAEKLSQNTVKSADEFHRWVSDSLQRTYEELTNQAAYGEIKNRLLELHPFSLPSNLLDSLDLDEELLKTANKNEKSKKMILQQFHWRFFMDATREQLEEFLTLHSPDSESVKIPTVCNESEEEELMSKLMQQFEVNYIDNTQDTPSTIIQSN